MTGTDSPLKHLVDTYSLDFANWLLDDEVRAVHPLSVELPAERTIADQVFQVRLRDDHEVVLHIEFQGRRSHRAIRWRMLDYIGRLAEQYNLPVCSVVMYVGRGAGQGDDGQYQVQCPSGETVLSWSYRVLRLWEMKAQTLLEMDRPALLPLVGQTRIDDPEQILPQAVARIRAVPEREMRGRMLTLFRTLLSEQEWVEMAERLIEKDELLLDTPYMRQLREEGREEGRQEGREEGRQEGMLLTLRRTILNTLTLRFDPLASIYQRVELSLVKIADPTELERLHAAAIQCETIADFERELSQPGQAQ
jgi:predicted transposase YdaD